MNVFLMYPARDFDPEAEVPPQTADLVADLELETLLAAMAGGDPLIHQSALRALLTGFSLDGATIRYRQEILSDCLRRPEVVREIYQVAGEAIAEEKANRFGFFRSASLVVSRSVEVLKGFTRHLRRLRAIADSHAAEFRSEGFSNLFARMRSDLDDAYFAWVERRLEELKFRNGIRIQADLGKGNRPVHYRACRAEGPPPSWWRRLIRPTQAGLTFLIHERDESGFRALTEIRDQALQAAADALSRSCRHLLAFFNQLRAELAFYLGCLNLHERLAPAGYPLCFPDAAPAGSGRWSAAGLYPLGLALSSGAPVVANDVQADGKTVLVVTGANQGGKSVFLRGLGVAQVMMQSGAFVPAREFRSSLCDGLFTHFRRDEDRALKSGKLEEELGRMRAIAERLGPHALLLMNESFAATNEREGSEIAGQVVQALREKGIRVVYVTHLLEFADRLCRQGDRGVLCLRADRRPDGVRTYRMLPGAPLRTSFAPDLYEQIFSGRSPGEGRTGGGEAGDASPGGGAGWGPPGASAPN